MRRTLRQWAIAPQRVFQRIPSHSLVELALGLPAVVFHLHENDESPLRETMARCLPGGADWPEAGDAMPCTLSSWQIINESPGGFAIRAVSVLEEQVRAGEIVALRTPQAGWMVASVRWLQTNDSGGIEMGLQVLSPKAIPVLIRPTSSDGAGLPAVLLPEISSIRQPARIAASKGSYIPLHELSVMTPSGEKVVRALKLIEQQMGYDLFDYQEDIG